MVTTTTSSTDRAVNKAEPPRAMSARTYYVGRSVGRSVGRGERPPRATNPLTSTRNIRSKESICLADRTFRNHGRGDSNISSSIPVVVQPKDRPSK